MNSQHIILWRHADAESLLSVEELDMNRALSAKGEEQAKKMASWLKQHLPKDTLILSSPAARAEQTVAALKREYQVVLALKPEAAFNDVLAVVEQTRAANILLVGHQPWIGLLATHLMNPQIKRGQQIKMTNIKKASVWWFKRTRARHQDAAPDFSYKLIAVQHPDFI